MTKYETAKKIVNMLELANFHGDLVISIPDSKIGIRVSENGEERQDTPVIVKPVAATVKQTPARTHKTQPAVIAGKTPIEKVQWARSPAWSSKVIKALRENKLTTVEVVEQCSIDDFKRDTNFSDSFIRMIREGLGTLDRHLLGDTVVKRA